MPLRGRVSASLARRVFAYRVLDHRQAVRVYLIFPKKIGADRTALLTLVTDDHRSVRVPRPDPSTVRPLAVAARLPHPL